jgi:5-deoxy-D-glucuronate isomerase
MSQNKWNNPKKLTTLKVHAENDILVFESPQDRAEVYIKNGDISKVIHTIAGKSLEIPNSKAYHIVVGENNWTRDVYHYLKPGGPSPQIRLGITKHRGEGSWSSLPHPFELNTEPGFEEVFYYLLQGGSGRAIQVGKGVWEDNSPVDDAWLVQDRSWCTIPMGYHPVVGEPMVKVSYIWAYLCKKKEWEKV